MFTVRREINVHTRTCSVTLRESFDKNVNGAIIDEAVNMQQQVSNRYNVY